MLPQMCSLVCGVMGASSCACSVMKRRMRPAFKPSGPLANLQAGARDQGSGARDQGVGIRV